MPNWCALRIEITGEKEDMNEFKISMTNLNECGEETDFAFFQTVPRPKEEDDHWYRWNREHWGTKWDIDSPCVEIQDECINIYSQTAWVPPKEWAQNASKLFPKLNFLLVFIERGVGFYGTIKAKNGEIEENMVVDEDQFGYDEENDEDIVGEKLEKFMNTYKLFDLGG